MENTKKIEKRFEIPRSQKVMELIEKYKNYADNYITNGKDEENIQKIIEHLTEYETVVYCALLEHKSVRKVAGFFSITERKSYETITELKEKLKNLYEILNISQ